MGGEVAEKAPHEAWRESLTAPEGKDAEAERQRIVGLYPLEQLGSRQLDRVARLAALSCNAPIGLVSIVEAQRQIFVGKSGLDVCETSRKDSFCAHCMMGESAMIVPDATRDERFRLNPLVTGAPAIRFYAGHPLISPEGQPLGAICIIDTEPREGLNEAQAEALETLAQVVLSILEGMRTEAETRAAQTQSLIKVAELERRFAVLADSLPQLVWSTLPDGRSDYFNRPWCEFTGLPAEASFGTGWLSLLHPEDAPGAAHTWNRSVRSTEDYEIRYRLRRHDGAYRWVIARGHPLHDSEGKVTRWIGTCTDIHDEMAAADSLELVSQELTHRIKNIFAVIGGLVSLSSRNHPQAADFARELYDRILALGRAHTFIGSPGSRDASSLHGGLKGMLGELLSPYIDDVGGRIVVRGDDITIDDRSATPLALVFHELATNSAKYGGIASATGSVEITLRAGDPLRLIWTETGVPVSGKNKAPGFGSRLIDMSIERQLGGEYSTRWADGALVIEIAIPMKNLSRSF
jgi:PAS domain S-box-containing protein